MLVLVKAIEQIVRIPLHKRKVYTIYAAKIAKKIFYRNDLPVFSIATP
jgi:hypothetical protein